MQISEKSNNKSENISQNTKSFLGFSPDLDSAKSPLPTGERSPLRGDLSQRGSFGIPDFPNVCSVILAVDLGTTTGWALRNQDGRILSGSQSFKPNRFEGGGMRYLRFKRWLTEMKNLCGGMGCVYFEEVRRHLGVDAAHAYGGFMAQLTAWAEHHEIPYLGVPVGSIKRFVTGKGNAGKEEVISAVRGLGHDVADDNEADALALLHYGIKHQGDGA